jgi:hypothetical protein
MFIMTNIIVRIFGGGFGWLPILLLPCLIQAKGNSAITPKGHPTPNSWLDDWLRHSETEFTQLERLFQRETEPMRTRLRDVRGSLNDPRNRTPERGFELLWERDQIQETLFRMEQEHELKMLKLRYRKSIEIVKMLYEKVLSMDHHFSSMKAQQGLSNLSNPNSYADFKDVKNILDDKMKKKFNVSMPAIFQSNPFLSAAFTVVGMVTSGDSEKKENVEKMACILDFTVRMHADLNTIYYETGYLRDANLTLKKECEGLFAECARQVGYTIPLVSCRDGDDWERLYTMLDTYVGKALGETTGTGAPNGSNMNQGGYNPGGIPPVADPKLSTRATINLQFSIDRVTQFIEKYSNFVGQGSEYYKKFSKIVDSYENEKSCAAALPVQFTELKKDIDQTLEKFNSAYKMPEVQGSKLKDMLYGGFVND